MIGMAAPVDHPYNPWYLRKWPISARSSLLWPRSYSPLSLVMTGQPTDWGRLTWPWTTPDIPIMSPTAQMSIIVKRSFKLLFHTQFLGPPRLQCDRHLEPDFQNPRRNRPIQHLHSLIFVHERAESSPLWTRSDYRMWLSPRPETLSW